MSEREVRFFDRRLFLRGAGAALVGLPALSLSAAACTRGPRTVTDLTAYEERTKGLTPTAVLTRPDEPGTPMVVTGRIFAADGKTPAAGVVLYVYHTDARGIYSERDGQGGPPDPRIKGWMKTDADGRYEFRSIRPASYPGTRNPQHIHAKVSGEGFAERYIPEYWFDDDPLVTAEMRARYADLGTFSPIVKAKRGGDRVFAFVRDIRLEQT